MVAQLLLYYFTGTGNSYRVATWMEAYAAQKGIPARVIAVDAAQPETEIHGPGQMVGLLCPTHGFTAPWWVIRFAARLPRGNGAQAFVLLTRAGLKLGSVFIPGLEGTGAYLLALILTIKGYQVRGVTGLDMPSNWTSLHPGLPRPAVEAITNRSRPLAVKFLEKLLSGQTAFRGWIELLLGLALIPFSLGYLLFGRFILGKLFFATSHCNGCGVCARACPVGAIRMKGRSDPRPYWTFVCESCTRCYNYCPRQAVEASWPFAVAAVYLGNIPLAALLLDVLARWVADAANLKGTLLEFIIMYPYKLLALAVAYFFLQLLLRIPIVNRVITLATPTHYYRRYREPETRLKDITRHT